MEYAYNDKETIENECRKAGFNVSTDSSVIYAKCLSAEEGERFTQFLLSKWGIKSNGILKLPFSYGFCVVKTEERVGINRNNFEMTELADFEEERDM